MAYSMSLAVQLSKVFAGEDDAWLDAYEHDAESRVPGYDIPEAITNEEIRKGDDLIGTYKVMSDGMAGGMGSVWRVHHIPWNTELAMKRPLPKWFAEGSALTRELFISECRNWISLGLHPHIVSCYYVREIGGVPSVFAEWMDGGSLEDCMQSGALYDGREEDVQKRILDIAIQTARGLVYAHETGLVHQDIKPGNILLSPEGDAKISDFGFARAKSALSETEGSRMKMFSPAYCSKEQLEGEAPAMWMDVYSWALTVTAMYLGGPVWESGPDAFAYLFNGQPLTWKVTPPAKLLDTLLNAYKTACTDGPAAGWKSIRDMEKVLAVIWNGTGAEPYPRERKDAASSTAGALNNIAMSYADLKLPALAERCWRQALTVDPLHFTACINEGIWLWRNAKITDLEMAERLEYFGTLFRHLYKDPEKEQLFQEIQNAFIEETCAGSEGIPYTMMISRETNTVRGTGMPSDGSRRQIAEVIPAGDSICYILAAEDGNGDQRRVWSFDIKTGAFQGERTDLPVHCNDEPDETGFYFRMAESKTRDDAMVLEITEPPYGRVLRSILVPHWDIRFGRDKQFVYAYPQLFADRRTKRLILASEREMLWAVFALPEPIEDMPRMQYRLEYPVSFRTQSREDAMREEYRLAFTRHLSEEDFAGMNDVYQAVWEMPVTTRPGVQEWMNRELMRQCHLAGTENLGGGIIVQRTGHDPDDPLPVGLIGIYPCSPEEGEDTGFSDDTLLRNGTCRDASGMTFWYLPGEEPGTIRIVIRDRQADRTVERVIRPDIGGRCVRRVIAASTEGTFLLADLADPSDNRPEAPGTIACISANGRWTADIIEADEAYCLQGIMLEDRQRGPDRGYLWQPGTARALYFERYDDCTSIRFPEEMEYSQYAIPLPSQVIPESRYERPRETIESMMIAADGEKMAIVTKEPEGQYDLYIWSAQSRAWERTMIGSVQKVLAVRDLRYLILGRREGYGQVSWSWEVFDTLPGYRKAPLWELREFSSETRVAAVSYDLCSLLDEQGTPVYTVFWEYGRQDPQ